MLLVVSQLEAGPTCLYFVGSAKMFSIFLMQSHLFTPNPLRGFVMTISMFLRNLLIVAKHSFCVTKSLVSILLSQKM